MIELECKNWTGKEGRRGKMQVSRLPNGKFMTFFPHAFLLCYKVKLNFPHRLIQLLMGPVTFPALSDPQLIWSSICHLNSSSECNLLGFSIKDYSRKFSLLCRDEWPKQTKKTKLTKNIKTIQTLKKQEQSKVELYFFQLRKKKKIQRPCCLWAMQLR